MQQDARRGIYARLFDEIRERKRPLVVGVNGAYTSGKTVFTLGLQEYLHEQGVKTQVIHYDDFHHPFSTITWTEETEIEVYYNHAFNPDKLVAEVLQPLKEQG